MENKIHSFERLMRSGAIFNVPKTGPWIFEDQEGNEIARGNSFYELIENCPADNGMLFSELDNSKMFVYLDEEYFKLNKSAGLRTSDQYEWRFRGDEEIFAK